MIKKSFKYILVKIKSIIKKVSNIKKYINLIFIGGLISLIIIICYIVFENLQKNVFYNVLINLSFSFLAATIFYIFQVIIPNRKSAKKALIILNPDIHKINEILGFLIAFTNEFFEINNDKLEIKGIDNEILYFNCYDGNILYRNYLDYRDYLRNFKKNLKNEIKLLKSRDLYRNLTEEFVTTINELDMEEFFNFSSIADLFPRCKSYQNIKSDIEKIKKIKNKLNQFDNNKVTYKIEILEEKEKNEYKDRLEVYKERFQPAINNIISENRERK